MVDGFVTQKVLELVLKNGVNMLSEGIYKKSTFMNGGDLSQAEAVMDLLRENWRFL